MNQWMLVFKVIISQKRMTCSLGMKFKNGMKFEKARHQLKVNEFGVSRGIGYTELLVDVHLILHIVPDNQEKVEEIYQFLKYPAEFPSLGRREDLANFEKVSIVEINEQKLKKR